jgi:hypothetical protein
MRVVAEVAGDEVEQAGLLADVAVSSDLPAFFTAAVLRRWGGPRLATACWSSLAMKRKALTPARIYLSNIFPPILIDIRK